VRANATPGGAQFSRGRPAFQFQQPQEHRRPQVPSGDVHCGREDRQQVGTQPVTQPSFVTGGPLVAAGIARYQNTDINLVAMDK